MLPDPSNRRSEERSPGTGHVVLTLNDPFTREIRAQLVDVSKSGFRASYGFPALNSGQLVVFQHPTARGAARVIWTRIVGGSIESGFVTSFI